MPLFGENRKSRLCRAGGRVCGVTLIETLIVLGLLGALIAILLPAISASRESSRLRQCQTKLRQLALAVDQFHTAWRRYPHGYLFGPHGKGPDSTAWSWIAEILPQVEQAPLYEAAQIPTRSLQESSSICAQSLPILRCPSDGYLRDGPSLLCGNLGDVLPSAITNYQAVEGSNWGVDKSLGSFPKRPPFKHKGANGSYDGQDEGDGIMLRSGWRRPTRAANVTDGLAHTFMLGENLPERNYWCCAWAYANNTHGSCAFPPNLTYFEKRAIHPYDHWLVTGFRSNHSGGLNFACADGSVHFVAEDVDLDLYRALATIAGGETVRVP